MQLQVSDSQFRWSNFSVFFCEIFSAKISPGPKAPPPLGFEGVL